MFFFFKQKTAYERRIRDWSSDVCSSDLIDIAVLDRRGRGGPVSARRAGVKYHRRDVGQRAAVVGGRLACHRHVHQVGSDLVSQGLEAGIAVDRGAIARPRHVDAEFSRSEEHTSELQSLMRISYAVFCLKKKKKTYNTKLIT